VNQSNKKTLPEWLPFVLGIALVVQFAGLGVWQISRGLEKRAQHESFSADAEVSVWTAGMSVRPYERLAVRGRFDSEHQLLLDNIILENQFGYYVLTPLLLEDGAVLLVNRGWLQRSAAEVSAAQLEVSNAFVLLHGRAGSLPRAGYRMGEAIPAGSEWPRHAVYPTLAEVAATLGREVLPFVLLLDPEESSGFVRYWMPEEMGPGRHFAYAVQWFAMGGVLAALLLWHWRRRKVTGGSND